MFSIVVNGPGSSAGLPVSVVDTSTGQTLALYKSVIDASVHVRLLESDAAGRSDDAQIDIGDLDPDPADSDSDDDYCPLCGDSDCDCPDDDDGIGEGASNGRSVRRIEDALIRLGAPPRERRPHR